MTGASLQETLLEWEAPRYGASACAEVRATLHRVVAETTERGHAAESAVLQIAALNRLVFRTLGLRFHNRSLQDDFALTSTVRQRAGNCLGLTSVYVVLAEALALPVRPLLYEGHIAAIHDGGPAPLQIELSRSGIILAEPLARRMHAGRGEGRPLGGDEFLAVHLSNRAAFVLAPAGQAATALELLDAAVTLFPEYTGAWINRALVLADLGRGPEAVEALARALALRPGPRTVDAIRHAARRLGSADAHRLDSVLDNTSAELTGAPAHGPAVRGVFG